MGCILISGLIQLKSLKKKKKKLFPPIEQTKEKCLENLGDSEAVARAQDETEGGEMPTCDR